MFSNPDQHKFKLQANLKVIQYLKNNKSKYLIILNGYSTIIY